MFVDDSLFALFVDVVCSAGHDIVWCCGKHEGVSVIGPGKERKTARLTHQPAQVQWKQWCLSQSLLAGSINQALIRQGHPLEPAHYYVHSLIKSE